MYWAPKMDKEAIGARFIAASKKSSTKLISKVVSKASKLIFHQILSFYDKSYSYFSFKQSWAIENSEPILEKIEKTKCKANAKAISRFDLSTLYTKLPHFDLVC